MTQRLIRIEEIRAEGLRPLGRHVEHDERSKNHPVMLEGPAGVYASKKWTRHIAPFDQGDLGSCTANAGLGAVATSPNWDRVSLDQRNLLNEAECVKVYEYETRIDGFPGTYPPDDTGSSGLAAAKTLKHYGFISAYTHAFSLDAALRGLMKGPGIFGIEWYSSFDHPDADGQVRIKAGAYVRGGHEIQGFWIDAVKSRVWFYQSWGPTWGPLKNGTFYMTFHTLGVLLSQQGDATFFVPN